MWVGKRGVRFGLPVIQKFRLHQVQMERWVSESAICTKPLARQGYASVGFG